MPGRDGTGPQGRGPATGGGWGPCLGRGDAPRGYGYGYGYGPGNRMAWGRGRGRGFCRSGYGYGFGWGGAGFAGDEKSYLQARAEQLRQGLDEVERRLAGLEGNQTNPA